MKTIQIKPLYTPSGEPTCRTNMETCKFYQLTAWGSSESCFWTKQEIDRSMSTTGGSVLGYTQPTKGCPLHETSVATDEP